MTPEQKELIKEYESVKLQMISLKERQKEIKEIIFPLMKKDEKIQLSKGKLYLEPRPEWKYSAAIEELSEELDNAKKTERADGTAEMRENFVLKYKRDKDNE